MKSTTKLQDSLQKHKHEFHAVIPEKWLENGIHRFDFTEKNVDIAKIDLSDKSSYSDYIDAELKKHNALTGIGGYNEDRLIYKRSQLFGNDGEARSVHLGVDIWCGSETPVLAPLEATVHSFNNNNQFGDYGPTIILAHQHDGHVFHTLYGHLSVNSLKNMHVGKKIERGERLGWFGKYEENGHWPPHLHFQLIIDMTGYSGDYPGVCRPAERKHYLANCPDPHLLMNINY